jgi:hypothetical protein
MDNGASCAGFGATHSLGYLIDIGGSDVVATIGFCWQGDDPTVAAQVHDAANNVIIGS